MKRKLIQQGGGGYTLYLPKRWVAQHGLTRGDSVEVIETDAHLIVRSADKRSAEAHIDVTGSPPQFIRMEVMNLYRLGKDRVVAACSSEQEQRCVKDSLDELLGFSLMGSVRQQKKTLLTLESISEPALEKYEAIVTRLLFIFEQILRDLGRDPSAVEALVRESYRYDNFCRRAISKRIVNEEQSAILWAFHLQLIHAIRDAHFLSARLSHRQPDPAIRALIGKAQEMLSLLKDAYLRKETSPLLGVYMQREFLFGEGLSALRKGDAVAAHHALDAIRNIYLAASPLFSVISSRADS